MLVMVFIFSCWFHKKIEIPFFLVMRFVIYSLVINLLCFLYSSIALPDQSAYGWISVISNQASQQQEPIGLPNFTTFSITSSPYKSRARFILRQREQQQSKRPKYYYKASFSLIICQQLCFCPITYKIILSCS